MQMCRGVRLILSFGVFLSTSWVTTAENDLTCSTAGAGRAAFRHREAVRWIHDENAKRAPYYIKQAKRLYMKGLKQKKGIDKTNNDPFIALYDAQHQVLAALDLGPDNATIWRQAGEATAMISSLSEDGGAGKALNLLAKSCQMDKGNIEQIVSWAEAKVEKEHGAFTKVKRAIGKKVAKWITDGVPEKAVRSLESFLPEIMGETEVCAQGSSMPSEVGASSEAKGSRESQIAQAVASMTVKPIFPTLITSVNVGSHFGRAFSDKLANIAVTKYRAFTADARRQGATDPNDINDKFFGAQSRNWPEMHNSKEYKQLREFLQKALVEHAAKTGYPIADKDLSKTHMSMWAAVYLEDGGRHGYHVHQSSISSCVYYAKAPPGKTPIMFVDPRGAPPTNDYEQHLGERDFEPVAPFHHNYQFFAEAGDVVCFPSWLVHRVPSHYEQTERVAFPANLQADQVWDAWYRSSTLS
jgi:uncharacterized protein (TIGR02466 family)